MAGERKYHSKEELDAYCRQNLYLFLIEAFGILHPGKELHVAPYLEAMCYALQEVVNGRIPRLMISIAPRHLKSVCGSVLLPAFILGHHPEMKIMVVSYGGELAREHAVLFRRLVESPFYRRLFPEMRIDPRNARVDHMKTTKGGGRHAVSLGGSVTGSASVRERCRPLHCRGFGGRRDLRVRCEPHQGGCQHAVRSGQGRLGP